MAVNAATVWEWRATNGSNTNGGGFYDADPGTSVDYSNQDSAQETYTTLATSGAAATTVTCGGGDTFAAGIAGNVIYIASGTNFTVGWYQVTTRNSSTSVVVDRSPTPGGAGSSGNGSMGGALALFTDSFLDDTNYQVAGVTNWVKNDGTMTLTGAVTLASVDGTDALPINYEGYNTSRGDNPTSTNRPLIACGANSLALGDFFITSNLRFTTTDTNGVWAANGARWINCAFNNSSGSASRYALLMNGQRTFAAGCDLQSANGQGTNLTNNNALFACYLHDSVKGVVMTAGESTIVNCVFDTCSTMGIDVNSRGRNYVIQNTIYNCGTGISGTTGTASMYYNNILDANTTGASWTSEYKSNIWDYNCWDNTTDTSNVTKGDNAVTGDPSMTDPANGDFSIPNSSNCVDTALDAGDYTGATV
jgi:hypothetical protein